MLRATLAIALGVLLSAPAAADEESEALVRSFVAGIDGRGDWSARARLIRSDGADTIVEELVLGRTAPELELRLGSLRLRDLEADEEDGFWAAEIEATDTSLRSDRFHLALPAFAATDVGMPNLLDAEFEPQRPLASLAALYWLLAEAEVEKAEAPKLTVTERAQETDDPAAQGSTTVYEGLIVSDWTDGVIARIAAGPITISTVTAKGTAEGRFASMEGDRLDLGAVAHLLDEDAYSDGRGDGVWRPALGRLRHAGITMRGEDGSRASIEEAAIQNLDLRQPPESFAEALDRLAAGDLGEDAEQELVLGVLPDIAASFRIGAVQISGVSIANPETDPGTAVLRSVSILGLSGTGIDTLSFGGFRFTGPEAHVALGTLELAGFLFPDAAVLAEIASLDAESADPETKKLVAAKAFAAMPRLRRFTLGELSAGPSEAAAVRLERFVLDIGRYVGAIPVSSEIRLDDLVVPGMLLRVDPESAAVFDALGYDRLGASLALRGTWEETRGRSESRLDVSVVDAVDFAFSYALAGLTEDWIEAAVAAAATADENEEPVELLASLAALSFEALTFSVTDRSLVDRVFAWLGPQQGVDGATYKQQIADALPFLLGAAMPPDLMSAVVPALKEFLAGGRTVTVSLKPKAPLPFDALLEAGENDPQALLRLLNMTVETAPAPPR